MLIFFPSAMESVKALKELLKEEEKKELILSKSKCPVYNYCSSKIVL